MFLYGAHHLPASSILFRIRSARSSTSQQACHDAWSPASWNLWSTPDLSFYGHSRHSEVHLLWIILSTAASIGFYIQQCVSCRGNPGGAETWYEGEQIPSLPNPSTALLVPLTTVVRLPTAVSTTSTFRIKQSTSIYGVRSTAHDFGKSTRTRRLSFLSTVDSWTNLARSDEQSLSKINVSICACLNFGKILRVTTRRLHLHT